MSRASVDQAVDWIQDDRELAERVASEGSPALAQFDLDDEEQQAIVDALRRDLQEAGGEVSGFAQVDFMPSLGNLIGVGRSFGGGGSPGLGGQTGWSSEGWIEVSSQQEDF
jgi:hypothetical protein